MQLLLVGILFMTSGVPGVYQAMVHAASDSARQFAADSSDVRYVTDGYDAARTSTNRRSTAGIMRQEDKILDQNGRVRLASNANDLHRNAILFAWAVRRHLDYTTLFDYQPDTGDDKLDDDLRALMERDAKAENCDIGGRHSWNRFRRLCEVQKICNGDVGLMQLRIGKLQGVESHAIKNPTVSRRDVERWELGVKLGAGRRAVAYCIQERDESGRVKERVVPAGQLMMLAAYENRFDQVRGISAIAGALDEFRDVYEIRDLMRAKLKLEQILGVAFFREKEEESLADEFGTDGDTELEEDTEDTSTSRTPEAYDLGQGVRGFDMNKDEDIKIINGNTPSTQGQEFLQASIAIAIKAFDLPFNFFDEAHTNFFGSRAAWMQYERACVSKREDQLELHHRYTRWRHWRYVLPTSLGGTAEIVLPASMSVESLKWRWVARGVPWWNPKEELTTDLMAAAAGLKDLQTICDERGLGIWRDNLGKLKRQFAEARDAGFTLTFQDQKLPLSLSFNDVPGVNDAAVV
jgi:hypothetical protein